MLSQAAISICTHTGKGPQKDRDKEVSQSYATSMANIAAWKECATSY